MIKYDVRCKCYEEKKTRIRAKSEEEVEAKGKRVEKGVLKRESLSTKDRRRKRLSHMETQEKGTPHRGTMTLKNLPPEEGAGLASSGDSQCTRVNRHSVFGSHTFRAQ